MIPLPNIWKYATAGLAVAALLLAWQNHSLSSSLETCTANLAVAQSNEVILNGAIDDQNTALDALIAEQKKVMIRAAEELAKAQDRTKSAEKKVAILLADPIVGSTLEQRVLAVDAQVLESVK